MYVKLKITFYIQHCFQSNPCSMEIKTGITDA